ncbi:MAG: gluconolactonase [Rhizobacter sp.]|nr:gluconolactonase [Rhizobacter sp.]
MKTPHTLLALKLVRAALLAAMTVGTSAWAQGLPPIYDRTPVEIKAASTLAEFPAGTFLENIAIGEGGTLYVNSYLEGKVYRIGSDSKPKLWASVDGTIAGIALNPDGSALVSGWIKGKVPAVFAVTAAGGTEVLAKLDGAMFPNGVVRIAAGRFLVADSYKGVIWEVNTETRSATLWLADELLARGDAANPTPAVNGIKLFGGTLYASNTAKQLVVKVPLVNGRAGRPEVVLKNIGLDDFDFDEAGVLYGATHVYNSLVRVGRDGKVTVLARLAQGMAGSTAVAYSAAGGGQVFVTTNGGMSMPPAGGVQTGKVVQVNLTRAP